MTAAIKHVFVLVLENRSFDHMLGASTGTVDGDGRIHPGTGVDAVTGVTTTVDAAVDQVNVHGGGTYPVRAGAPFVLPADPPHEFCDIQLQIASVPIAAGPHADRCQYHGPYPPLTMAGFVASYANQAEVGRGTAGTAGLGAVMACYTAAQLPVLSTLAREFAVCDQWFSALPGPTWPNRFFLHAATSGGLDRSPTCLEEIRAPLDGYRFANGTIYHRLGDAKLPWLIYHGDLLPQVAAIGGMSPPTMLTHFRGLGDLAGDLKRPDFGAAYVFIEPHYGHVLTHGGDFRCGNSQHPVDDVTRGEALIKYVYESIRQSPHWPSSLLVVTYDEHGGFFDHVPPPPAVPPGDLGGKAGDGHGFRFDRLGVRVPAVVVSPWIPGVRRAGPAGGDCNLIDHTSYDHTSLLATVERLYGLPALTARDAQASDFIHLLAAAGPRDDAPWTLPEPADSGFSCREPAAPGAVDQGAVDQGAVDQGAASGGAPAGDGARPEHQPVPVTMRGFLELAAIQDARINPAERDRIAAGLRAIETAGQARGYLADVTARLRAARAGAVRPG